MRDIKFRAWDKHEDRMHYGIVNGIYQDPDEIISFDRILDLASYEVMEFTDKPDKNGKEIYEGDIIEGGYHNPLSDTYVSKKYIVEYSNCHFVGRLIGHSPYGDQWLEFIDGEVIGNIYENPELLDSLS